MEGIQFDNDFGTRQVPHFNTESNSFLTNLVIKFGAKDYAQAQKILSITAIIAVILTIIVIVTQFTSIGEKRVPASPSRTPNFIVNQ
ncbi:MAG: hypothetical protein WC666_02915 [Candidatus Paceibacterota bacterium]|jgi:amino acid transporter